MNIAKVISACTLTFLVAQVVAESAASLIQVRIRGIASDSVVQEVLDEAASTSKYESCEVVEVDFNELKEAVQLLDNDSEALELTPVNILLPGREAETFYGTDAKFVDYAREPYARYVGESKSNSTVATIVEFRGVKRIIARFYLADARFDLEYLNDLQLQILCRQDMTFEQPFD